MSLDIKKLSWKVGRSLLLIFIVGALSVHYDQLLALGLIPVFEGLRTIIKHSESINDLLEE